MTGWTDPRRRDQWAREDAARSGSVVGDVLAAQHAQAEQTTAEDRAAREREHAQAARQADHDLSPAQRAAAALRGVDTADPAAVVDALHAAAPDSATTRADMLQAATIDQAARMREARPTHTPTTARAGTLARGRDLFAQYHRQT